MRDNFRVIYVGTDASDALVGGSGPSIKSELFIGRGGDDYIYAKWHGGRDLFFGGSGNDEIETDVSGSQCFAYGGRGDDILRSIGNGSPEYGDECFLVGGPGADTFYVADPFRVLDFQEGIDTLILL